mmetsp:Transcript_12929/g.22803  ORF Transcript_12929/g.22803 Transcript_12929/m.22803 type:complete len:167 (+) Transcript_12929:229-729(+)
MAMAELNHDRQVLYGWTLDRNQALKDLRVRGHQQYSGHIVVLHVVGLQDVACWQRANKAPCSTSRCPGHDFSWLSVASASVVTLFASLFKLVTGNTRHPVPDHIGETIELGKLIMAGVKDGTVLLADYIELADAEVPPAELVVTEDVLAAAVAVAMAETATHPARI